MSLRHTLLAALVCLCLSGCFQIQLNGGVGNAELSIAPLRFPGHVQATATSWNAATLREQWGEETWANVSDFAKLLSVGVAQPALENIDPDTLYLVTATGGVDYDPQLQQQGLSESPEAVQGRWHAIVAGERILEGNIKVSALTHALYLQVRNAGFDALQSEEILTQLDAAATLVVGDVDQNGTIDYSDVLRFHRNLDTDKFHGDLAGLDALANGIRAGQPEDTLATHAAALFDRTQVSLVFDTGTVALETLNWEAPITAANFLHYVNTGFYDQTLVHRAINNFMIQMGWIAYLGLDVLDRVQWETKEPGPAILNEASNRLSNTRGTLAMARTSDPNSATSQFFINQVDNTFLDYGSANNPDGYAVFARVISGMAVVDGIAGERTTSVNGIGRDVPARGVILESATVTAP
ncbi:peptidylprolyl isomerase [Halioglobus sp. HI00S01]|uniref:peptidylprolyl isomerase n=1 Tax=Halioglobus sp. HI00S01 TaxID=1822214 RepID=UPI00269A84FD